MTSYMESESKIFTIGKNLLSTIGSILFSVSQVFIFIYYIFTVLFESVYSWNTGLNQEFRILIFPVLVLGVALSLLNSKAKGGLFILIGMNLISSGIAVSIVLTEYTFRPYYVVSSFIIGLTLIFITNWRDPDSKTWIGVYIGGILTILSSIIVMFWIHD